MVNVTRHKVLRPCPMLTILLCRATLSVAGL
jgi:hypothetical protein